MPVLDPLCTFLTEKAPWGLNCLFFVLYELEDNPLKESDVAEPSLRLCGKKLPSDWSSSGKTFEIFPTVFAKFTDDVHTVLVRAWFEP